VGRGGGFFVKKKKNHGQNKKSKNTMQTSTPQHTHAKDHGKKSIEVRELVRGVTGGVVGNIREGLKKGGSRTGKEKRINHLLSTTKKTRGSF